MDIADGKRAGAKLAVVMAAAVLLTLLLASPALAAPFATSLMASPSQSTLNVGDSLTISAVLTDTENSLPVGGQLLRLEEATSSQGPWSSANFVSNDGENGDYSLEVYPAQATYYRFVFEGTDTYGGSTSNVVTVNISSPPGPPPYATSLTASPGQTTVDHRRRRDDQRRADRHRQRARRRRRGVRVEQASSSGGPWSLSDFVTNDGSRPASTASTSCRCGRRTTASSSRARATTRRSRATLSPSRSSPRSAKPTCPSSVKKSKTFTVKGTVQPGAPGGPAVKIQTYRKLNGSWSRYKSAYSTSRSGAKYSVKIKIKATGKFKFKATVATSATFVGRDQQLQQGADRQEVRRRNR